MKIRQMNRLIFSTTQYEQQRRSKCAEDCINEKQFDHCEPAFWKAAPGKETFSTVMQPILASFGPGIQQ